MKILIAILLIAGALAAQMPTGTATPVKVESGKLKVESLDTSGIPVTAYRVVEPTRLLKEPTRNFICNFFVANWGESRWPGTRLRPWSYPAYYRKTVQAGKGVCDNSRGLEEVNGR